MKRCLLALPVLAALLAGAPARAQTAALTPVVYTAVDAVTLQGTRLTVAGVVQGQATSSTQSFTLVTSSTYAAYDAATLQACVQLATIAMAKPGAYLFQVVPTSA